MNLISQNLHHEKSRTDYLFYLVPIFLFINLIFKWLYTPTTTPDSFVYFSIAEQLPALSDSSFPFLFPLILKLINIFVNDYFLTYKIICAISLIFCLVYTRNHNFYWKEIWLILAFKPFLQLYPYAWSEVIIVPLFLYFIHKNFQYLNNQLTNKSFIISNSIVVLLMIFTKYNSVFYVISLALFILYVYWISKDKFRSYLASLTVSVIIMLLYFSVNFFFTGTAMGERESPDISKLDTLASFSNFLYNLNPFFYGETNLIKSLKISWNMAYVPAVAILVFLAVLIYKKLRSGNNINQLIVLCLICSLSFSALTIYSYFTTKIDDLGYRLLLGYYLPLFLAAAFSVELNPRLKNYTYLAIFFGIMILDLLSKIRFILTS